MKTLVRKAYAKVNLVLDVLRKRPDGYHDVRMVMQNLNLYDELTFRLEDGDSGERKITLTANRSDIPTDSHNLIYKAISLMFDEFGINAGISVHLEKHIPVEAGMAGGSTDCAATLHAVNELFALGADEKRLMELGVRLGADVPYCVMGRTALSEGIGEKLTPVAPLPDCYVLVAKPPISVSTGMVYTRLQADRLSHHPDVDGMLCALQGGDLTQIASHMENVLETVTIDMHPEIELIKSVMKEHGAQNAIMSGSGPTVFGIYTDKEAAGDAAECIRQRGLSEEIYLTTPI
ncbi:MAG: 4-(cytidine 5'-diphospho)-2-C-methyl-D-erythritol kinase [Wujia sp.]